MAEKIGNHTIELKSNPKIKGYAAVVGKKEAEGPLSSYFDVAYKDEFCGEKTFEKAETLMQKTAIKTAIHKAGLHKVDIDCAFAGDLLNQCIGSSFGMRDLRFPFCGLYGACSTMALSLALAGIFTDSGAAKTTIAAASSHFCSAERQYRYPLEYGGQRPQSAQWTVTGAGACVVGTRQTLSKTESKQPQQNNARREIYIDKAIIGSVRDLKIKDPNNMGAAMAPEDDRIGTYPIRSGAIFFSTRI